MHVSILSVCSFLGRLSSGMLLQLRLPGLLTESDYCSSCRRRVGLSCETPKGQSRLVPGPCHAHLRSRPDLRPQHREPPSARSCLWSVWPRLWLLVRRLPIHCCRVVRHPWSQPELGLHDARPCDFLQYLQHLLWSDLRRAHHSAAKWRARLHGRARVLQVSLLGDFLCMHPWTRRCFMDDSIPARSISQRATSQGRRGRLIDVFLLPDNFGLTHDGKAESFFRLCWIPDLSHPPLRGIDIEEMVNIEQLFSALSTIVFTWV